MAEARAAQQAAEGLHYMESQVLEAQARVDEALGRLAAANAAPHEVAMSRSQADTASAEVAQARAAVEHAELELASTKLYAPEAGRVTRKAVEAGAYVQIGQAVMAIVPREVWVVANFMETQLATCDRGNLSRSRLMLIPPRCLWGTLTAYRRVRGRVLVCSTGERHRQLRQSRAAHSSEDCLDTAPDPDYPLSPGMSVVPVVRVQ